MMFVTQITPKPEDEIGFSFAALREAPEASGCYALTISDGMILYIGQAINISERMEQHLNKGEKKEKTPWGIASRLYYRLCDSRELNNLENGWINEYKIKEGTLPFFNKINPPA